MHLNKPVRAKELTRLAQRLLAKPSSAAPDGVQQPPLCLEGATSSTVFVVDDDRAIREAMRDLLQENGYAVELFADGAAFLEAYRPGREGCLLVDALMPGMSGIELIERLKAEGHELPAIVITGNGAVPMAVQAMKAGAVDFIEKPVGHEDLLASVKRALDQTRDTANVVCIAGDGCDARCQSDDASAADPGPRPRRPSKQEHRRRSRHQPAHGRQPSCGHHEEDRLEVPSGADPHGARCGLTGPPRQETSRR